MEDDINLILTSPSVHTSCIDSSLDKDIKSLWELEAVGISRVNDVYGDFLDVVEYRCQRHSLKLSWRV